MIRIQPASDLHVDISRNDLGSLPEVGADVIVVAGDMMAPGTEGLRRLRSLFKNSTTPIVYVAGNHDFYSHHDPRRPELKTTWQEQREQMPLVAAEEGIIFLDDAVAEIDGVRFVGSTLWTDFSASPAWMSYDDVVRAAAKGMNDYRLIKIPPGRSRHKLQPRDTIAAHRRSVEFIERTLTSEFDGETVLVTHHSPSYRSLVGWDPEIPGRFRDLDWCYASGLERWFTGVGMPDAYVPPVLALHGHIHRNVDYTVGHTRIVANPRGYPLLGGRENPNFDPALVLEIEPKFTPGMRI
jgi:Icc-related predicted phosphoesterase